MVLFANGLWLAWLVGTRRWDAADDRVLADAVADARRSALMLGAVAFAIVAVLWWFARAYGALAPADPGEAATHSADWRSYLTPPRSTWLGQLLLAGRLALPSWSFETTVFLGFIALGLSIVGLVDAFVGQDADKHRRPPLRGFFVCLALMASLLSFGPSPDAARSGAFDWSPFAWLTWAPGMQPFRAPARFALLVVLSVAILSAAGADAIARWRRGSLLLLFAVPLILLETFPFAYEIGRPHPVAIPPIYRHLRQLPPAPMVSLPAFTTSPTDWFEADYMLFATVHWRPMMNGYSRASPPGHARRMAEVSAFPAPVAIAALRRLNVGYVVTHARRYGVDLRPAVAAARLSPDVELLARIGDDYLWRVKLAP